MKESITDKIKINTIKVLLTNEKSNEFGFNESAFSKYFGENTNMHYTECYLKILESSGIISLEIFGEDNGFYPDWEIKIIDKACLLSQLEDIIIDREKQIEFQNTKIVDLQNQFHQAISYNPESIQKILSQAKIDISNIKSEAIESDLLSSLIPTLNTLDSYLSSINNINQKYFDVYLNIIKPIQDESKSGVRATAIWAIVGIIITTIISVALNFIL